MTKCRVTPDVGLLPVHLRSVRRVALPMRLHCTFFAPWEQPRVAAPVLSTTPAVLQGAVLASLGGPLLTPPAKLRGGLDITHANFPVNPKFAQTYYRFKKLQEKNYRRSPQTQYWRGFAGRSRHRLCVKPPQKRHRLCVDNLRYPQGLSTGVNKKSPRLAGFRLVFSSRAQGRLKGICGGLGRSSNPTSVGCTLASGYISRTDFKCSMNASLNARVRP